MGRDIVALDNVTVNNIGVLKKINEVVLPCKYPESWYNQCFTETNILVQLGYYAEIPVGAIKARVINNYQIKSSFEEEISNSNVLKKTPNCVYIESFAVLPNYRHYGIGSKLLEWLIEQTKKRFVHEIIIHVQTCNESALEWYTKKGFEKGELVKDYYKNQELDSPDAFVMKLRV
ncbi:NAT5 [Candida oxycetoniae]|uniref:NAT5 n=1 Tax=Candida oxycetoniae TaxID=497107 RepID=A0AAI9SZD4_9ASCO|nr:NAT5 [Candida oxycetoniae]KAI3405991.2 NAT5 [Candida oxycetoniae]